MVPFQNHSMFPDRICKVRQEILFSFELPLNQLAKQDKKNSDSFLNMVSVMKNAGRKKSANEHSNIFCT